MTNTMTATTATTNKYGIFENAADRNYTFDELKFIINNVVNKYAAMIRAGRLDWDDVRQELALEMIRLLDAYDPERCPNLEAHLTTMLGYHLIHMRKAAMRHGIMGAPRGDIPSLSLNQPNRHGYCLEIAVEDVPTNLVAVEQEIDALPKRYRNAIDRFLMGKKVTPKTLRIARSRLRCRLQQVEPQVA